MASFAKINDNNEVLTVLYIEDEKVKNEAGEITESIGQQHLQTHNNWPAEKWILSNPPTTGRIANIGYIWDPTNNIFLAPKPFPSWVKNTTTAEWDPPVDKPDLTAEQQSQNEANSHTWVHEWNEEDQSWTLVDLGPEVL